MTRDICRRSAAQLAADVRTGRYSPVEVVDAFLDRIDERNAATNAFVTITADRAREQAKSRAAALEAGETVGPLHGVPVAIKDLTPVEGVRHTSGAKPLADNVADHSAPVVERLEAAGAVVLGKTNTPEFGHRGTTDSLLFGPTANPFDTDLNAGGSSGGSAAAVSDALVPLAQGTDGGGSVRIPASFCGLYGLKPSFGRIPRVQRPNAFCDHTPMLHHGPLARTVEDAALMLDVTAGAHPRDPFSLPDPDGSYRAAVGAPVDDVRVAYSPDFDCFPIDPDVRRVVEAAVDALGSVTGGATTVDLDHGLSLSEVEDAWKRGRELGQAMTARSLGERGFDVLGEDDDLLPTELTAQMRAGLEHSAVTLRQADAVRTTIYDAIQDVLEDHDLLAMPTLGVTAFENESLGPATVDGRDIDPALGWRPTYPFNLTGHPVASVPAGFADGLPVGLQLVGRRGADAEVLAASAAFERVRPWQDRYPFASA
jgi:Asp-tRNA(Asn)/Glu-tRNA(Gln) amidotransferase A subunit family amidase